MVGLRSIKRERPRREQHHGNRRDDRDEHDRDVLRHADRSHDAVDGKHEIEQQNLADGRQRREPRAGCGPGVILGVVRDVMMNLARGFPHEEHAAGNQNQIAPREAVAERFEDRRGEPHDQRDGAEQAESHHEREPDADALRARPVLGWQLVGEDRNEDEVVDAEHDFHHDERREAAQAAGSVRRAAM